MKLYLVEVPRTVKFESDCWNLQCRNLHNLIYLTCFFFLFFFRKTWNSSFNEKDLYAQFLAIAVVKKKEAWVKTSAHKNIHIKICST